MFKNSFIILRNALIVSIVLFFGHNILADMFEPEYCYGIDCQNVLCPDDYMIKVQSKIYIKCEDLQAWVNTRDNRYLLELE